MGNFRRASLEQAEGSVTIDEAKALSREYVDACAERVLNGTATPADAEALALWTKHTVRWIRALAAREAK